MKHPVILLLVVIAAGLWLNLATLWLPVHAQGSIMDGMALDAIARDMKELRAIAARSETHLKNISVDSSLRSR